MKYTALTIIAVAVLTLTGCSWLQQKQDDVADTTPTSTTYERISFEGEKATSAERAKCEAAGGEVRRDGLAGWENCIQPYADAGATCTDSSECQGRCLADDMGAMGQTDTGTCQQTDSPFGCFAEMENGRVGPGLCVD